MQNTSVEFRERKMITFRDETDKLRFSVKSKDILYVESTDNYVTIITAELGKIKKNMLRKTMKRLEKELEGTYIQRCHRSYMVNFENIKQVKLISTNLYIYLDFPEEIKSLSSAYVKLLSGVRDSLKDHIKEFNVPVPKRWSVKLNCECGEEYSAEIPLPQL